MIQPRLRSLATAVPPFALEQKDVAELALKVFSHRESAIERLLPAFHNAGIERRYSCVPLEWYLEPANWESRNRLYLDNALDLITTAATQSLERAGVKPEEIDSIVTVSTTGIATPSLDARLMERLPFRRDVERLPIFGLGCAGGALGLGRAAALARGSQKGSGCGTVLLLVVELCALTFRPHDQSKSNVIAMALFGDGAAAAVIGGEEDAPAPSGTNPSIAAWGEHTWPDSLDVMGWRIKEDGFGVYFTQAIPDIIRERFATACDNFLAAQGLSREALEGVVCHPGGAKVIEALETVFGAEANGLTAAREVLRDFGNMSAATVLFVLERLLQKGLRGPHLLSAMGPGFSAGFTLLEAA